MFLSILPISFWSVYNYELHACSKRKMACSNFNALCPFYCHHLFPYSFLVSVNTIRWVLYSQCTQSMAALKLGLTEREIEYREQWFRSDEGLSSISSGVFVS